MPAARSSRPSPATRTFPEPSANSGPTWHEENHKHVENLSRNRRAIVGREAWYQAQIEFVESVEFSSIRRDRGATGARQVFHKGRQDVTHAGKRRTGR